MLLRHLALLRTGSTALLRTGTLGISASVQSAPTGGLRIALAPWAATVGVRGLADGKAAEEEPAPEKKGFFSRIKEKATSGMQSFQFDRLIKEFEKDLNFDEYMQSRKADSLSKLSATMNVDMSVMAGQLAEGEAIVAVMTPEERKNILQLTPGQVQRIANASITGVNQVQLLVREYNLYKKSVTVLARQRALGKTPKSMEEFQELVKIEVFGKKGAAKKKK